MLKFSLDELTMEGLEKLADAYGIPRKQPKADLVAALKPKMATGAEVVLDGKKRTFTTPVIISIFALIVSAGGWGSLYYLVQKEKSDAKAEADKNVEAARQQRNQSWQDVMVFKILQEGTKRPPHQMSFEEIRKQYVIEAKAAKDVDLSKEELQPLELYKILANFISLNMAYVTIEDNYCIQRTATNLRVNRAYVEETAKYSILHELTQNGGKHDAAGLYLVLNGKKVDITQEEYNLLISQLRAANVIWIDESGKLFAAANLPKKKYGN